jgi:hypothetical protein
MKVPTKEEGGPPPSPNHYRLQVQHGPYTTLVLQHTIRHEAAGFSCSAGEVPRLVQQAGMQGVRLTVGVSCFAIQPGLNMKQGDEPAVDLP